MGMYFPVMALNAYWAVRPPKNAAKGAKVPLHVYAKVRIKLSSGALSSSVYISLTILTNVYPSYQFQGTGYLLCFYLKVLRAMKHLWRMAFLVLFSKS